MEIFEQTYPVSVSDMDITYHLTPNAILMFFQDCVARFLTSKHLAAFDILKQDKIWVITDFEMRLINERPLWASEIKVEVQVNEISALRVHYGYRFLNDKNEAFAEGTSTWVVLDIATRRPFMAREMLLAGGIVDNGVGAKKVMVPKAPADGLVKELEHVVNITDLDFNGHVSNRTYLNICTGTLSVDFSKTYSSKYLYIKFNRESFFGDTLVCKIRKGEDERYWYDIVSSDGKDVCDVYVEWEDHHEELSKDIAELIKR